MGGEVAVIVGVFLMVLLGSITLLTAVKPQLPVLRAGYWWRVGTNTIAGPIERAWFAVVGIGMYVAAGYFIWDSVVK